MDSDDRDLQDVSSSPTDVSMEAVLELAELQKGIRSDAPSLKSLFDLLKTPSHSSNGECGVSMLADVRSYTIFRDSMRQADPKVKADDFRTMQGVIEDFFKVLEEGVAKHDEEAIEIAKKFCSAINSSLLSRQMSDIYSRRERSDARYVSHESSP